MRFDSAAMPQSLLHFLTLSLLSASIPAVTANPILQNLRAIDFNHLIGRQACAVPCGWNGDYCCQQGQYCYTDSAGRAQCGTGSAQQTGGGSGSGSGYWSTYTTTYVRTDLVTVTSVGSSFVGGGGMTSAPATATAAGASCNYARNESPCGSICCASNQYCVTSGQCGDAANGGSSGYYSSFMSTGTTVGFLPPLRPTDSTLVTRTAGATAVSPTTTVAFLAPVATGANVTVGAIQTAAGGGGGLSPGAIAGIVIGVLLGLALLFLICFYCCLKGLLDGVLALFGFGKKRRREREREEYVETRRSSRRSGRDDRSWYGDDRPSRVVERRETTRKRSSGVGKEALGIGAGLAGLAAALGLKRARDKRRDEKSQYTASSAGTVTTDSSLSSESRSYIQPPTRARSRSRAPRSISRVR